MAKVPDRGDAVVPAQLAFLAIYNPSLGITDETVLDQVVYYFSTNHRARRRRRNDEREGEQEQVEEENEKLRQIGLAQGMVEFAKAFSDGQAVDSVETEKSRIILHQLEYGWWILASIDLTRLNVRGQGGPSPKAPTSSNSTPSTPDRPDIEYSAREVSPPALLLQQLLRAHSIFLLHHGSSLQELHGRLGRRRFCVALERFWTKFVRGWDVLLHGNPAAQVFRGIKLAAGGELGIGVGEEEWGSGEREVLEGLIKRSDGMVDLIVSRFGEPIPEKVTRSRQADGRPGGSEDPSISPSDGVVFSGGKAITKESLRAISNWMELVHLQGLHAYGVRENPNSTVRPRWKKAPATDVTAPDPPRHDSPIHTSPESMPPHIPPPILDLGENARHEKAPLPKHASGELQGTSSDAGATMGSETFMKYLKLGYGTHWGMNGPTPANEGSTPGIDGVAVVPKAKPSCPSPVDRYFLIGLQEDLEQDVGTDKETVVTPGVASEEDEGQPWSGRILPRTIHVELEKRSKEELEIHGEQERFTFDPVNAFGGASPVAINDSPANRFRKVRVVVYICRPFMFTFLFELQAPSLAIPAFYRSLHQQLGPLQRPLLNSTSPAKVSQRVAAAAGGEGAQVARQAQPIFDLIYDPVSFTIHSSIPDIPNSGTAVPVSLGDRPSWTRLEALNVHTQLLSTYASTRLHSRELERTCKTSRGWWIVWMRLPHAPRRLSDTDQGETNWEETELGERDEVDVGNPDTSRPQILRQSREAFLVRKASDHSVAKRFGGLSLSDARGPSASGVWDPRRLAEGIGVDAKRYIEGLFSMSR
ncbi:MAG: hypothetical protein M1838_003547 [Thelocarpon superellum]|nr:MAG: hypothetical protein M1838_003547 [Thelocarpon superellum]